MQSLSQGKIWMKNQPKIAMNLAKKSCIVLKIFQKFSVVFLNGDRLLLVFIRKLFLILQSWKNKTWRLPKCLPFGKSKKFQKIEKWFFCQTFHKHETMSICLFKQHLLLWYLGKWFSTFRCPLFSEIFAILDFESPKLILQNHIKTMVLSMQSLQTIVKSAWKWNTRFVL